MARTMAKSWLLMPSMVKLPRPGMPKKDSSTIAPVSSAGSSKPAEVMMGIKELRKTWVSRTVISDSPLARAVRT